MLSDNRKVWASVRHNAVVTEENEMSDTLAVQICLIIMFVAKALLDEWRLTRQREYERLLKAELKANTELVAKGNEATKANVEDAKDVAKIAAEKATNIETVINKVEEKLNGGDAGLGARVSKNEARLENLEKGQRTHDEAIAAVARSIDTLVINFATFAKSFDKTKPSED
jgi:hypothetical protein